MIEKKNQFKYQNMHLQNIQLYVGDCRVVMKELARDSIHMVLTDPPYFLDGLDDMWKKGKHDTPRATGTIGGLPVGMKFSKKKGHELQKFIHQVACEIIRIIVPGGIFLCFSQPRLVHRTAVGIEDAGFEIRDLYAWNFTKKAQFKAFSQNHFIEKMPISEEQKTNLKKSLNGRKTPQLRPQFETIIMAQKPKQGTYVENWQKWKTGLINPKIALDGTTPTTLMTVEKPGREEKGKYNSHLTPKPVTLLDHLIRLFTQENQTILDPFIGSGSTAVAAIAAKRKIIGIDREKNYIEMTKKRLSKIHETPH